MKTKKELLDYSIKMRKRGDTYRSVLNYLIRNENDESIREEILKELDDIEKQGVLNIEEANSKKGFDFNRVLGLFLIVAGGVLISFLWGKGLISTIPFIIIGAGFLALSGVIK